jgi:hypothetical protein
MIDKNEAVFNSPIFPSHLNYGPSPEFKKGGSYSHFNQNKKRSSHIEIDNLNCIIDYIF